MRCQLTITNINAIIADTRRINARASIYYQISATQLSNVLNAKR